MLPKSGHGSKITGRAPERGREGMIVGRSRKAAVAIGVALVVCGSHGQLQHRAGITPGVDQVLVQKSKRKLILMKDGHVLKTYRVALGKSPVGHKQCEGDNRTPEGRYTIDWRTDKSRYRMALHISYPNRVDVEAARKRGCRAGGDIMIHGLPKKWAWLGALHRLIDWTRGCVAVTNAEIDEIYAVVRVGTPIRIDP